MSTPEHAPVPTPLIALVHRAHREMQLDMARQGLRRGYPGTKPAHSAVFTTLPLAGARTADLAARARITRQSMGEVVREMVELGVLEMTPDPNDRRAKLVTYTEAGLEQALAGRAHILDFDQRMVTALGAEGYERLREGLLAIVDLLENNEASEA